MSKTGYQNILNYRALNVIMDGFTKALLVFLTPLDWVSGVTKTLEGRLVDTLPPDVHDVVVFGCGYRHVNKQIEKRLDAAYELYRQDSTLRFFLSGTEDDAGYSEPQYMRSSLHARGVPTEQMVLDGEGFTTERTVDNYLKMVKNPRCIVATSDYHLRRCVYLFQKNGADAYGFKVERDPDPYRYRYWLRDIAALYQCVWKK